MKAVWCTFFLGSLYLGGTSFLTLRAEEPVSASSVSVPSSDLKNSPNFQKLEKQLDDSHSLLPGGRFNSPELIPQTPIRPPNEVERRDKKEKQEKDKNWLSNALDLKKEREPGNTTESTPDTSQREEALKSLANKQNSNSSESLKDQFLVKNPDKSSGNDDNKNEPGEAKKVESTSPWALSSEKASSINSASSSSSPTTSSSPVSKFTPAVSGLSSASTGGLSPEAQAVYDKQVKSLSGIAPITPITPITPINTSAFDGASFTPIAPVSSSFNTPSTSLNATSGAFSPFSGTSNPGLPSEVMAKFSTPISPTLNTNSISPIETRLNLPSIETSNSRSTLPARNPAAPTSSIYKSKVADPNDFFGR